MIWFLMVSKTVYSIFITLIQTNQVIHLHILHRLYNMRLYEEYREKKKQTHVKHKLIEKQDYGGFVTMEGDENSYSVSGFDQRLCYTR